MAERPVVLVVEDDVEMNQLERELLDVHGFDSVPAHTGNEALEACRCGHVDAVLLDLMLPELDGFETCRLLRTFPGHRPVVIIVSALDSEDSRRRGFESGADAYFAKPFDPDEVIQTMRSLLRPENGRPQS